MTEDMIREDRNAQYWYEQCQKLRTQLSTAQADAERLREALRGMLLSADCTWEERNEGHDWAEACSAARAALVKPE